MSNRSLNLVRTGLLAGMLTLLTLNAEAMTQIDLGLDVEFSGGVAPVSTNTPWLCAQFSAVGNNVLFTLTAPNLTDPESAKGFYLNFDDTLDVMGLSFVLQGTSGSFTLPTIQKSQNAYKADGDGYFDIRLDFATGASTSDTFGLGDEITYLISYNLGSINELNFAHTSAPGGGNGTFYAAAHVQNTGGSGASGWIGATEVTPIPEPTSIALSLLGLAGLGSITTIRKRNNH